MMVSVDALVDVDALCFAEAGEAAALAAFLGRLVRWDKSAAVRLQARGEALAVFGQPAMFKVLAVRTAGLAEPVELDITVSAGELLEGIDEKAESLRVPGPVTGPPWAGLLPPHGGWRRTGELPPAEVRAAAAAVIAEFRQRSEALAPDDRTQGALDALAEEIWSRSLVGTPLPLRAVHAAQALGFLRPAGGPAPSGDTPTAPAFGTGSVSGTASASVAAAGGTQQPLVLFASGPWLRLRTPYGSVAVRRAKAPSLQVTPVR